MSVYSKDKSSYLQIDFQVNNVRYSFSSKTSSKAEARRIEARAKKEARRLATPSQAARDCTFDQAAFLYWDHEGQAQRKSQMLKGMLLRTIAMVGRDTLCSSIDLNKILSYRRDLRKGLPDLPQPKRGRKTTAPGAYTPKSVNNYLSLVFTVLNHAERVLRTRWPLLPKASSKDIDGRPILEPVEPRKRYLTVDEELLLEKTSEPNLKDMWKLDLEIAFREANLCEARWSEVDWHERTIQASVKAKGRATRIHTVYLSDQAMEILNRRKGMHEVFIFTLPAETTHWHNGVLRRRGEAMPVNPKLFYERLQKACKAAGIKNFSAHDLRRTAARRMWQAKDIHAAQVLLGHRDIDTTIDYIGLDPSDLAEWQAKRFRPT